MDHQEAVRTKAAEQYLLGELPTAVRDEFEEHFMTCGECAADIRLGAAFVGNIKDAFRHQTAPDPTAAGPAQRQSWIAALFKPSIAAPAFAILLAVIAYQGLVVIPRLRVATAPIPLPSFSLLSGSSRGEASVRVAVTKNESFGLYVDIPPQPVFPLYTLAVEGAGGAFEFSLPVSAAQARNTVEVFVPAGRLDAGDYEIVIRGAQSHRDAGTEIGRLRFSLKYTD
jgi:hypothetical protein